MPLYSIKPFVFLASSLNSSAEIFSFPKATSIEKSIISSKETLDSFLREKNSSISFNLFSLTLALIEALGIMTLSIPSGKFTSIPACAK